jgi:hypothetical protein
MITTRKIFIFLISTLLGLTSLAWTSCDNDKVGVTCDNIVCDTINTYLVKQTCDGKTVEYNLTYTDTVKLERLYGEITFEIHQCKRCQGMEYVDLLSHDNLRVGKVKVNYNGGGQSEKINIEGLSSYIKSTLKVNWSDHGKVFYITN